MIKFIKEFLNKFFNKELEFSFRNSYFPFTCLSFEVDIFWNNRWLEVAGCGIIHPNVFKLNNRGDIKHSGFAFGFGVDRLCMLKYGINDLRLLYGSTPCMNKSFGVCYEN